MFDILCKCKGVNFGQQCFMLALNTKRKYLFEIWILSEKSYIVSQTIWDKLKWKWTVLPESETCVKVYKLYVSDETVVDVYKLKLWSK